MKTSNVHEAKTNLSQLLNAAAEGDEVIITRRGGKVTQFKLVPIETGDKPALFGALKGKIVFSDHYDTADQEVLELFEKSTNDEL
jgi:prevent-host-death family protein